MAEKGKRVGHTKKWHRWVLRLIGCIHTKIECCAFDCISNFDMTCTRGSITIMEGGWCHDQALDKGDNSDDEEE
jgi:hypothetical protein